MLARAERLPLPDAGFDAALSVRLVHHLPDPAPFLREVARVLRPGGVFVVEYANKRHGKAVLAWLLRRRRESPFARAPGRLGPTIRLYHPRHVAAELRGAGFAIESARSVGNLRAGALKRIIPAAALARLDYVLQRPLAPLAFGPSMFLRCVRRDGG